MLNNTADQNKTPNYFTGQFLKESDFQLEQEYHLDANRLHNRLAHTPGVAEGFKVTFSAGSAAAGVSGGVAIDTKGRVIYLGPDGASVTFSDRSQSVQYIVTSYNESFANETTETGVKGFTRVIESPLVEVALSDPGPSSDKILIAKVTLLVTDTSLTIKSIDHSARRAVGAIAGESLIVAEDPLSMSSSNEALKVSGDALITGALSIASFAVTADASIGGTLDVNGPANISGPLNVGADLSIAGNLEVKGTTTSVNTTEVELKDNIMRVNTYAPRATPIKRQGGLEVFRGGATANPEAQIVWDETKKKWFAGIKGKLSEIPVGPLSVDAASGNVGIGTTATPSAKLEVAGPLKANGKLNITLPNSGGAVKQEALNLLQTSQNTLLVNMYGGDTNLTQLAAVNAEQNISIVTESNASLTANTNKGIYIKSGGNVGIGETNPLAPLTVKGAIIRRVQIATGLGPNDATNNGRIASRILNFVKKYDETAIRIVYCDNFRVYGHNTSARWQIRINDQNPPKGELCYDRYNAVASGSVINTHYFSTIFGFVEGIKAGNRQVQIWVTNTPGYGYGDAHTGWNNQRWTIEAQEVWIG